MKILNISGVILADVPDLRGANLSRANLSRANLRGADLRWANLIEADLRWANLSRANLIEADLRWANLSRANLRGANLSGADLRGANLSGADLESVILSEADLATLESERSILPAGDLIGWKKLMNGLICKLKIPASAERVGGVTGRKCRASIVEVLDGRGSSDWDNSVKYFPGLILRPTIPFDPNPLVECASGIHFFITKLEAERY